jgi:hypothetical protein
MTSGQDVSQFLDTLDLVKSYFSSFLRKKFKKNREFFFGGAPTPQRIRRFASLQDCLVTLTCHLTNSHIISHFFRARGVVKYLVRVLDA